MSGSQEEINFEIVEDAGGNSFLGLAARGQSIPVQKLAIDLPVAGRLHLLEFQTDAPDGLARTSDCDDPYGSRIWPTAHSCALRLLELGVAGHSVLELGCGCGMIALAAE